LFLQPPAVVCRHLHTFHRYPRYSLHTFSFTPIAALSWPGLSCNHHRFAKIVYLIFMLRTRHAYLDLVRPTCRKCAFS
jgi:hypothetical protein